MNTKDIDKLILLKEKSDLTINKLTKFNTSNISFTIPFIWKLLQFKMNSIMYYFVSLDISFGIFFLWILVFSIICSRTLDSNKFDINFNMNPHKDRKTYIFLQD